MERTRLVGRPPIRSDQEILRSALRAFAAYGYAGTSVRALNAELGLSHEAIRQRFGSKRALFEAAVDLAVTEFEATAAEARASREPAGPVDELRLGITAFLRAARDHPELGRILNFDVSLDGETSGYLIERSLVPWAHSIKSLLNSLHPSGGVGGVTARDLFFLLQAAVTPFSLPMLSSAFDGADGAIDPEHHIDRMTEVILRGLQLAD